MVPGITQSLDHLRRYKSRKGTVSPWPSRKATLMALLWRLIIAYEMGNGAASLWGPGSSILLFGLMASPEWGVKWRHVRSEKTGISDSLSVFPAEKFWPAAPPIAVMSLE